MQATATISVVYVPKDPVVSHFFFSAANARGEPGISLTLSHGVLCPGCLSIKMLAPLFSVYKIRRYRWWALRAVLVFREGRAINQSSKGSMKSYDGKSIRA